jgi:ankyrin repeat protein
MVFYLAAAKGYEKMVRLLLDKGPDVKAKEKNEWTESHPAAEYATVRLLLEGLTLHLISLTFIFPLSAESPSVRTCSGLVLVSKKFP